MRSVGSEFKQFLMRGNVVDLAIAVILGAAFGAVVTSLVANILTPLIAAIFSQPDFADLSFDVNDSTIMYGLFLNAVIAFLVVATVVFFFVVKPMNYLIARSRKEPTADPTTAKCPFCLSEVPIEASRCAFCTSELTAGIAPAI